MFDLLATFWLHYTKHPHRPAALRPTDARTLRSAPRAQPAREKLMDRGSARRGGGGGPRRDVSARPPTPQAAQLIQRDPRPFAPPRRSDLGYHIMLVSIYENSFSARTKDLVGIRATSTSRRLRTRRSRASSTTSRPHSAGSGNSPCRCRTAEQCCGAQPRSVLLVQFRTAKIMESEGFVSECSLVCNDYTLGRGLRWRHDGPVPEVRP